jgi:CHAT domain-containing protein
MRHLYREINTGQSPAGALRGAKRALMHSGDPYNRPYFWGPQQVFTHRIERNRAGRQ